jgi:hypothetical protein
VGSEHRLLVPDDEAGALEMLNKAPGNDLRHNLVGLWTHLRPW